MQGIGTLMLLSDPNLAGHESHHPYVILSISRMKQKYRGMYVFPVPPTANNILWMQLFATWKVILEFLIDILASF